MSPAITVQSITKTCAVQEQHGYLGRICVYFSFLYIKSNKSYTFLRHSVQQPFGKLLHPLLSFHIATVPQEAVQSLLLFKIKLFQRIQRFNHHTRKRHVVVEKNLQAHRRVTFHACFLYSQVFAPCEDEK